MERTLEELFAGDGGSYILPFFWQHGESEAVLREYMDAIEQSKIREVCLECRPHPDFCGPGWWRDMDIIMEEARARGMGVWLLDDSHFPTGYANGGYIDADPSLCKQYLSFVTADVHGMTHQAEYRVTEAIAEQEKLFSQSSMAIPGMETPKRRHFDTDQIWRVMAYPVVKGNVIGDGLDITDALDGDVLTWDVPAGMWRIYVIYFTQNGGGRTDYMNPLNKDSVRVLIDQVYEPVYARYAKDFGKTFRGFFSDEPLAGNCADLYDDKTFLGERRMALPWSGEMPGLLEEQLGADWLSLMPLLWDGGKDRERTGQVRYAYMNAMTQLISQNFSVQLGDWCESHGVEYIGHMVEDQNRSATVNYMGDYFRALKGQHMAGIDVIGGGILPGAENRLPGGEYQPDGDFYHFMLAKLGAGLAHMDPRKKGRAMVELFGAYGWSFGVRSMKYLADHFLVRGINHFVPHAFSPKAFPDPDCPPHFYAHGENPQFRAFGELMAYMQRTAHLISGGQHIAPAALLHSGMASWSGMSMDAEQPARELAEGQIDFDLITPDIFASPVCSLRGGKLVINEETFDALVIPEMESVGEAVADFCAKAKEHSFPVFFVGGKPKRGADFVLTEEPYGEVVALEELAAVLRGRGLAEITVEPSCSQIRYYHYRQTEDLWLFSNESMGERFEGTVTVPARGYAYAYDAMEHVLRPVEQETCEAGTRLRISLSSYEMMIVAFAEKKDALKGKQLQQKIQPGGKKQVLEGFTVSFCGAAEYPAFRDERKSERLTDIGRIYPDFGGFIRYETTFDIKTTDEDMTARRYVLEIEDAYECVEVWCNESRVGSRICPDYLSDLTKAVRPGENRLRIEVATTLARRVQAMPDVSFGPFFRRQTVLEPLGIVGDVILWEQE